MSDDAFTIIDNVAQQVTFDELMRRDPTTLTQDDRKVLVRLQRARRAQSQARADERKAKKETPQ